MSRVHVTRGSDTVHDTIYDPPIVTPFVLLQSVECHECPSPGLNTDFPDLIHNINLRWYSQILILTTLVFVKLPSIEIVTVYPLFRPFP